MREAIRACVKPRAGEIFMAARRRSDDLARRSADVIDRFLAEEFRGGDDLCFVATGSVGRREAMEASDLDLVPIARSEEVRELWREHDAKLRQLLRNELGIKVSKGEEMTSPCSIEGLVMPDKIGGPLDSSAELTKRVLILTESVRAGGALPIELVRKSLLDAYGSEDRTSGRHTLSLCNDIARYYKTLCIEYIPRANDPEKDWGTRNIKLRHSRKFWYFANIVAIATLAEKHPHGDEAFKSALLDAFSVPPAERLSDAMLDRQPLRLGRMLETYANFLDFMAKQGNRDALAKVRHEDRYEMRVDNPFLAMKFNSDLLHQEIMAMMEDAGLGVRSRIIGWFML